MVKRLASGLIVADPNGVIETKRCPYWSIRQDKPKQSNGYCAYGEIGDWQDSFGMLWDQLKLCGENRDDDEDENLFGIPIEMIQ